MAYRIFMSKAVKGCLDLSGKRQNAKTITYLLSKYIIGLSSKETVTFTTSFIGGRLLNRL